MPLSITLAKKTSQRSERSLGLKALAVTLLVLSVVFLLATVNFAVKARPSPSGQVQLTLQEDAGIAFPKVDWNKWEKINPAVIAWLSIPHTNISYPVALAPKNDAAWYLHHDVYGNYNPCGVLFVEESTFNKRTPLGWIIYGHHMRDGSMFAPLANYTDRSWLKKHRTVLIQTRSWKCQLKVRSARIINANATHTGAIASKKHLVLCTCSYGIYQNQRTLVSAS